MAAHDFHTPPAPAPPAPPAARTAAAPLQLDSTWSEALVRTIKRCSRLQQDLHNIAVRMSRVSRDYEILAREVHRPQLLILLKKVCIHALAQHADNPDGVAAVRLAIHTAIAQRNAHQNTNTNQNANAQNTNTNQDANAQNTNINPNTNARPDQAQ
ncbi:hypothetical protein BO79DRAFT_258417 [Aspergillus costaricaensis CBS 115574]|uniref:Uncharacterized protein n=1 Tax=Aspergillus costaricaensis CBS 115574 TaxID=1448317 RepID=A0ACD1I4J1_9EURO|nr:hypothetical protein BO79DRAFT_258417 [Aspergillus costaricaensis CBS 115574]RAK85417.1 hypothetical protein BO79DRAFT_258417 [Aspergillus costaricaensis CBS 115574]